MEQVLPSERSTRTQVAADSASREDRASGELVKLLSLTRSPDRSPGPIQSRHSSTSDVQDWSASLDLVERVVGALRTSAERTQSMEARTQAVLQQAARELEGARARVETLEARLKAFEIREKQAEARAKEAEGWLRRIHDVVANELPLDMLDSLNVPNLRQVGLE